MKSNILEHNSKLQITKSNDLIHASYKITIDEMRLIQYVISKIDSKNPSGKNRILQGQTFTITVKDWIQIYGRDRKSTYAEIKEACDKLFEREINPGQSTRMRWVSKAQYFEDKGYAEINIAPEILPYLTDLKRRFTSYKLMEISGLNSVYSIRIYEILSQFQSKNKDGQQKAYITIEEIRAMFGLQRKYKNNGDLIRRVIKPAVDQINKKTGINVLLATEKKGREIIRIAFKYSKHQS